MNTQLYEGRTVLVTGASGGLGTAVTRAFLDAGAHVVAASKTGAPDAPAGPRLAAMQADLATREGAEAAVAAALRTTGRVDVLAHLVGGFAAGSLAETDGGAWDRMMDINLRTAFHAMKAVFPGMLAARYGRIVAVGSRTGVDQPAGLCAYNVSKAALHALVRSAAAEGKGRGVTVNAVLPSVIDTAANRAANPDADFTRWVRPASIAGLILWLCSEAAGDISGALVPVYGGA